MSIVISAPVPRTQRKAAVLDASGDVPLLRAEDLDVADTDGTTLLHEASFEVGAAEIVAIIGDRGGWTTALMETLAGVRPSSAGRVTFRGEDVTNRPAHHVAGRGLRYVPSAPRPYPGFTVFDHVLLGAAGGFGDLGSRSRRAAAARALATFPALRERARQPASTLSDAERLLLALAQTLAGGPALLLLDDPLARLPATIGDALLQFLETSRADGTAILFADAAPARSLSVADRGYVVEGGRIAAVGPPALLSERFRGSDP